MAMLNSNLKGILVSIGLMGFLVGGALIGHSLDEERIRKGLAETPPRDDSPSSHRTYGPTQSDYTLTLYSDLECPYCKAFQPIAKRWIDSNEGVNLRWHHLPLEGHGPVAVQEALLAECNGQVRGNTAFWTTVDAVFALTRSNGQDMEGGLERLPAWADQAVRECMARPEPLAKLQEQIQAAHRAGITATPTSILTDNRTGKSVKLEGLSSSEALDSAVDWLARE